MTPEVVALFHSRVDRVGGEPRRDGPCWPWKGTHDDQGYGTFWQGKERYAHRTAWRVAHGNRSIPTGKCIRHTCDIHDCVNPAHLVLGSRLDNVRDAVERGQLARGSKKRPELSESEVAFAREEVHAGRMKTIACAKAWQMSSSTASDIITGRLWRHVPMPDGVEAKPRRKTLKCGAA